jgi:outer membrane protein assembly factor BamB
LDEAQLSRRKLIGATTGAGIALAGGAVFLGTGQQTGRVLAQDETAPEATPVALGGAVPEEFETETNWPVENYDLIATRDVKGTDIGADTVAELGDAWTFAVTTQAAFGNLTAHPTIVDGVVYIQDAAANVYALDMESGEQLWAKMYDDVVPSGGPNGVAAAYGLLFTTVGGVGDVVALDPASGEEVWKTNIKGPLGEGITTSPLVHDNRVYVSTIPGSSETFYAGGQRGNIYALDAASGAVLWYFETTQDNLWGNPTVNSGGGFWHPPSVDADGRIYVPVANPAPYPGTEEFPWASSRPGDNLYTDTVLKMDPETATLDWYAQIKPGDVWDLDNQLTPVLVDLDDQSLAIASGKHGYVVALDRESGEEVWRTAVGTHQNDDLTQEDLEGRDPSESIEVWPGTLGGVETPLAYSADAGLIIAPVYELPSFYVGGGFDPDNPFDFTGAKGVMVALNVADGSVAWETPLETGPLAGATITNDIVFSAGLDGVVQAFSLEDGSEVFRYQASAGINAPLAVSGDFLIVPAGGFLIPSANTVTDPAPDGTTQVIALKLGGTVQATPEGGTGGDASPVSDDQVDEVEEAIEDSGIDTGTPEATPETT